MFWLLDKWSKYTEPPTASHLVQKHYDLPDSYGILLLRLFYGKIQKSEISIRTPDNGMYGVEEIPQRDCTYGRQCVSEKCHFIVDTRPVIHVLIIQT